MKNELPKLNKASWIRNFGRSVKYAVTESFNEHFPMAEAYKNQSPNEDLKFARKELRTGRKFLNFVSKTTGLDTFFGDVDLAYKNMKTSMKSGNFYNSRRARKAEKGMFEAFGVDSSELDDLEKFLKSDFNDESEESLEKEGIANDLSSLEKDLESGFNDTSQIISEAVTGSADYIAGSIKGAASASYATSLQTIRELKFGFNNLNSGIAAINMFNKEQMSAHIANTTKYFETTTNLLQEQNAMIKGLLEIQTNLYESARKQSSGYNYDPLSNIIDPFSGALNIDQYISHVKENFEKASGMGNIIKLLKVKKDEIIQNPMHFLLKQSLSILGGDRIEKALDDMQKNIVNSLYTLNAKISRGGGGILSGFLSLLGIKEKTLNYANTTFEKGPMQYNGAANKSIVEVIPTYLARIEAALTGGPARFYDMERGTWTTAKEVRERWNKKSSNTGNSVQSFVKNAAEKIVNNEKLGTFTPEQQRDLRKMLAEDVIPALRSSNGVINKSKIFNKDRTLNSEFLNTVGLKGKNYDKDMVELVGLMFEQMNDSERRALASAARSDRYAKSQALNDIGNNPYDINNIIVNGALSGTMESKYHLDRHSLATVDSLDKKFGNGILGSGDIVTKILNSIYDEVYDIHTLMEKGSGGYKKKYKGASGKSNRSRIDFRKMISDEQERLDYITDIDEEKATGVGDLFGGNVEIDFTGADETVQDFINFVRNDLLRVDSFKLYIPTHQNRLVDFCNVLYNVPFGPTGNTYFDDFVKELKKTPISEKEDIFTWVNDPDHAILIYKLIRAIKYREDPNKVQSRYSDNKDKTSAVRDALKGALYKSPTDTYNSFEGEGFFDKLSKARGFDKLDVITSKIKSLTEKPTNFLVKGVNTASSFLGNLISGEFGNALSDITSLFGGGRAFGGTIPGPWPKLYALSPGEKVIPAYKNPDNPNRRKSNPMLDAIKENLVINRAREAGVGVAGGFLTGTDSVPGDDSDDPFSNLFEKARSKFNDFKGLGEELFDKQLEDYLKQYISDNELLKAAKEAIKARDLDKLKLVIASIPIKEAQQKIKESGETIWGKLGDIKDNIPSIIKMIPDSVRENIKDIAKYTGSGAAVGLASGLIGGPFGLVGGTLLGSAVGLMKHSEEAQNMFFGPGLGNSLKKFFGSNKKGTNLAAVGATVGGLVGGPFGVVGGLILGTGLNFVKSSEKFDEFMFGEKGLVTKMDNFFGETFKKTRKSIGDYIKEAITEPIDRAIIPVGTALQIGFKKSFELLEKGLRDFVRPKLFDFSKLIKKGVKGENKYLTGALGGAAGGAMVGGPFGAVVGGLVGSIAHGTGFDKKLVGIGKLPGKLLNSFSNRLAAWEISSGQGFNWSAQERINKMREIGGSKLEDYEKSNQFKIDTKLSQSKREDLIDAEMLIAAASGKNPEYKQALKEAIISIENALVTAGVDSSVINYITSKLTKDKKNTDHAKLFDELVQKQPNIPESAQKELASPNGDFAMGVKRYINILDFIEKYVDNPNAKENARKELQEKWNIGEDDFDKAKKNIRAEKDRKPLEKKNTITYKATDAIIEYGKLLSTNISSGFERVSNYLHSYSYMFTHPKEKVVLDENGKIKSTSKVDEPNRTETKTTFGPLGERIVTTIKYADDGSVVSETQEAFASDGRRIELDDVGKVDQRTQEAREAEIKKEKDQEFKDELLENVKIIKDNGGGFSKFLKNLGKGAKGAAKGIFGGLKDIFNFIASPLKTMFGMFDSFMDSIPVIGDYWNAGKRMARMEAKSIGRKAISWAGSKLNKAAGRVSGWMRGKSNTTGIFDGTKFSGMRDFSDYLKGSVRLYAGKDYKFMDLKDRTENLTKKEKKLLQKVMTDPNFIPNKQELDVLTKIQNTKVLNSEKTLHTIEDAKKRSLQYQAEDILTSRGTLAQDVDMKMRGIRNKYSSKNISNKLSDMYLNAGMKWQDGTYYKKFGDKYLELADRLSNTKYGKGIADKMLSDNYLSRIDNLFGVKGTKLGNRMLNDRNLTRAANWATRLGTAGSKAVAFGTKALGGVAKFAGKWGGKILGGVLDVIDMMAIQNAMTDAASAVNPQDEMEALTIIAQNSAATSAAMPLLGEAIKNNNPNSGALGDLVMEGGKFALSKVGIGGAAAGAAGTGIGGTLAGIGSGITATAGGIYGAAKTGLLGAKTAVVSGAKSAGALAKAEAIGAKSSVVSFIKTVFEKVASIAKKFLKPETVSKLGELMGKIITNVSKPGVLTKLAPAVAKKAVQIASGPIGWAIMAGFVAHSFYKGYDDAEKIWKPKDGEELTVFKKAMCGIANVLYNDCLLSIVFDMDQIIGFIKQLFQDPEDKVTKGIAGTDNADDSNSILQKIKDASSKAWEGMTSDFNKGIGAVGGFVENIKSGIQNTFGGFIDKAKEFGNKVADAIDSLPFKNGIGGMIESALKPLKDLYNRIFGKSSDTDTKTIDTTATPVTDVKMSEPTKFENEIQVRSQMKGRRPRGDGGFGGFKFKLPSFKWGKGNGGNGTDYAQQIWDYLSSKGLGSNAIAGIMGNIQAESGFIPNRVQGAGMQTAPEITVDGETGYGLCQWTYKSRQQGLKDFAASRGKSSSDLQTQLDYMLQEMSQSSPGLAQKMAGMSPYEAALLFHKEFERSADTPEMAARRGDYAKAIAANEGRGITTAGTYSDGRYTGSSNVTTGPTYGGSTASNSGGGIFSGVSQMLENSALGQLGQKLFGNAGFFTSGLFSGLTGSSYSGGTAGGAGTSRTFPGGEANPVSGRSGCADYKQDDPKWIDHPYASSTVGKSGCMPSSFCNMASMYGIKVLPPEACEFSASRGRYVPGAGTACAFYPDAAEKWNVPVHACQSWEEVMADLRAGKPVAAGFEGGNGWSVGGHWMLMTHLSPDGKIYVADSRAGKVTGKDISGYHPESEAKAHWAGPGYAFGADNVPTHTQGKTSGAFSAVEFMTKSLKGSITGEYMEGRDGGAHGGIDIGANLGTPIKSPVDGEVTKIAYEPGGYGNYLQIRDSKGKYHLFAHLKDTPRLELGNKIKAGQEIAYVGSTGFSSGPHLHYQIDPEGNSEGLKKGPHLDPNKYQIDEKVRSFVEEQNSVADFKRMQEMSLNEETDKASKGDGGFLDPLKDAIAANKAENYNAKLDAMIAILGSILEVIKLAAGNVGANNNGNTTNTAAINSAIPALAGAGIPKLTTTTPGKSIQSIIENMIKIATDNT